MAVSVDVAAELGGEFGAAMREREGGQTITLGGREWHLRRKLPFGLIMRLSAQMSEGGIKIVDALSDLVVMSVRQDEREAFRQTLHAIPEDDDDAIDFTDVGLVARRIVELVTGSPFDSASDSPPSPSSTGGRLLAASASGGSPSTARAHARRS